MPTQHLAKRAISLFLYWMREVVVEVTSIAAQQHLHSGWDAIGNLHYTVTHMICECLNQGPSGGMSATYHLVEGQAADAVDQSSSCQKCPPLADLSLHTLAT